MAKEIEKINPFLTSYRFEVTISGKSFSFRSISGIKLGVAFEPLAVGGRNNAPALLPIPVKDTGRLVMERGVSSLNALKLLVPGAKIEGEIQILVPGARETPNVSYHVSSPILESIELAKLDAMDSSVLIESLTFLHEGITMKWKTS